MKNIQDYADYQLSVMLKKYGFNKACDWCIVKYPSAFVYDGDPNHPESHKRGEKRVYNLWNRNIENAAHEYALPHLYDVATWLRNTYQLVIYPYQMPNGDWYAHIEGIGGLPISTDKGRCKTYESALLYGCKYALKNIVSCMDFCKYVQWLNESFSHPNTHNR